MVVKKQLQSGANVFASCSGANKMYGLLQEINCSIFVTISFKK